MPRRRSAASAVLLASAACAAGADPPRLPSGAPAPRAWKQAMETVEQRLDVVERNLAVAGTGDLRAAAAAANDAAELLRLGYGPHERKDVPAFARMARDAESWLLQVALEARQAHEELARDRFRAGHAEHCTRCHDAVEAAGHAAKGAP